MAHPTSFRLPDPVKHRLDARAARTHETPSVVAVRLIDEGLRMAEHPGVTFHDSAAHGRVAAVMRGPDVAEIIDVLTGLAAQGEERLAEVATWLAIHPSQVRAALGYYTAFRDEIDHQNDLRRRESDELRRRLGAEHALLG